MIGTRSFGADPDLVARHAAAAVTGLQSAGVAACAKHFPGHGSTEHRQPSRRRDRLRLDGLIARRDLPPFVAAIEAGVRAVMPGHLRVPGLAGDLPASLSAAAQTGLLRGELGFDGVIVSDALEMRAVSAPYGIPEAAVMAVAAGTDLLCFGRDQDQATYLAVRDALVEAVRSGRLPAARLEESAARVWRPAALGHRGARTRAGGLGRRACRPALVRPARPRRGRRHGRRSPGAADRGRRGRADRPGPGGDRAAVEHRGRHGPVGPEQVGAGPTASTGSAPGGTTPALAASHGVGHHAALAATASRAAAAGRRPGRAPAPGRPQIRGPRLLAARPDAVVVEMGLPVWHPPADVYLVTFGATRASSLAAAELLGLAPA